MSCRDLKIPRWNPISLNSLPSGLSLIKFSIRTSYQKFQLFKENGLRILEMVKLENIMLHEDLVPGLVYQLSYFSFINKRVVIQSDCTILSEQIGPPLNFKHSKAHIEKYDFLMKIYSFIKEMEASLPEYLQIVEEI